MRRDPVELPAEVLRRPKTQPPRRYEARPVQWGVQKIGDPAVRGHVSLIGGRYSASLPSSPNIVADFGSLHEAAEFLVAGIAP